MVKKLNINANEVILRPRFQLKLPYSNQSLLEAFEQFGKKQNAFIINRVDDHIFIKYPNATQQFWTPQLHLEINTDSSKTSILYGLFGPIPSVWLMFMFLHFLVALAFLCFCIWGYTNWSLGNEYITQTVIAIAMIIIWISLYIFGRIGRNIAKPKMRELKLFMDNILKTMNSNT